MTDYWIKLYLEILDDPKMATLPDRLWRRTIEVFLLAGKLSKGTGMLPETRQLAWCLRMNSDDLELDLQQIALTGIITRSSNGWIVNKFQKRQAKVGDAERKRQQRERDRRNQYYQDDNVTMLSRSVTQINRLTDNRLTDTEAEEENNKNSASTSYSQTGDSFISKVFTKVTGMIAIPGSELSKVLPAMESLRNKYPNENDFINYLLPYWEWWKSQKTKDKRGYSRTNCAWIYDIAIAGKIPDEKQMAKLPSERGWSTV